MAARRRVVLTQVIARHGDRAPAANLTHSNKEHDRWHQRLPSAEELQVLDKRFPVKRFCRDSVPFDAASYPFGALTKRGGRQLESLGAALLNRHREGSSDEIFFHEVEAQATDYVRTQRSCQYLLRGLFGDTKPCDAQLNISVPLVSIINPFDTAVNGRSSLWERCQHFATTSPHFNDRESSMGSFKEILFSRLPGLIRGVESGKQHERKMQWLKAMDHFVCAESHGDELAHPELEELGAQVAQHAAWRFHQWYSDPTILSLVSGPLMNDLGRGIEESIKSRSGSRIRIFLGHDVTILALHRVLRNSCATTRAPSDTWWPSFASTLVFELLAPEHEDLVSGSSVNRGAGFEVRVSESTPRYTESDASWRHEFNQLASFRWPLSFKY